MICDIFIIITFRYYSKKAYRRYIGDKNAVKHLIITRFNNNTFNVITICTFAVIINFQIKLLNSRVCILICI